MKKKKLLWDLFFTFAKIGLFTFGGGYAMLSLIEHQCVEIKKWITHEDLSTITAIAESRSHFHQLRHLYRIHTSRYKRFGGSNPWNCSAILFYPVFDFPVF